MKKVFNKWVKGEYRYRNAEQVLKALKRGKNIRVQGYEQNYGKEYSKDYTMIYEEDLYDYPYGRGKVRKWPDSESLEWLRTFKNWQLWRHDTD